MPFLPIMFCYCPISVIKAPSLTIPFCTFCRMADMFGLSWPLQANATPSGIQYKAVFQVHEKDIT